MGSLAEVRARVVGNSCVWTPSGGDNIFNFRSTFNADGEYSSAQLDALDWMHALKTNSFLPGWVLTNWFDEVGSHFRYDLSPDEVMDPAPGTRCAGVDVSQVIWAVRRWVAEDQFAAQRPLIHELRNRSWWDWMVGDTATHFEFLTPDPVKTGRPNSNAVQAGNHFVVEVVRDGEGWTREGALLTVPKNAPFVSLVNPILDAVGLWPDVHLWHFQVLPDRKTPKFGGLHPVDRGAHLATEDTMNIVTEWDGNRGRWWQDAETTTLNRVVQSGDVFWFFFDYGACHLFRVRVFDGDRTDAARVKRTRQLIGARGRWPDEVVTVQPLPST